LKLNFFKIISLITIALILWGTYFFGSYASKIEFKYDVESFFSQTDPDYNYYKDFKKTFENENDFILVGLKSEKGIFKEDFLRKTHELSKDLRNVEGVKYVTAPTTIRHKVFSPMGSVKEPILHFKRPEKYLEDSLNIYQFGEYVNAFFSKDAKSVSIFIKKEKISDKKANDNLLYQINALVDSYDFDEYHTAGRIKTQNYYVSLMNREMKFFVLVALVLLILYLWFTFKTILGIVVPMVVILISLVWTLGTINMSGHQLNLMMTILPSLLFVIGISDSVHLLSKFAEGLRNGLSKVESIVNTIKEIGVATFLTSFTTAAGFAALLVMDNPPIQKFGIFASVGIMITYVVSILLLPAFLFLLPSNKLVNIHKGKIQWNKLLSNTFFKLFRLRKQVFVVTAILVMISIYGVFQVRVNNFFLDDLDDESSLKGDLKFFENNFSGIRPFEMGIDVKGDNTIWDMEVVAEIEKMEKFLKEEYEIGYMISPLNMIRSANRSINDGMQTEYLIPEEEDSYNFLVGKLKNYKKLKKYNLVGENFKKGRISGKTEDIGSTKMNVHNIKLEEFIAKNIDPNLVTFELTGSANLLDNTNEKIAMNMMKGLVLAILIIFLTISVLFKSIKLAIYTLIPNIIPLVFIGALMGFLETDLKVSTSLIFSIGLGIAVDDSIHFLTKFKREFRKSNNVIFSLRTTFLSTGRAIIVTSLILTSGFVSFMFSDMSSTFNIGLLISITLFVALLTNLFLFPLILAYLFGAKVENV